MHCELYWIKDTIVKIRNSKCFMMYRYGRTTVMSTCKLLFSYKRLEWNLLIVLNNRKTISFHAILL